MKFFQQKLLGFCFLLFGCNPAPDIGNLINNKTENSFAKTQAINVYFATNRELSDKHNPNCSNEYYSSNYSTSVSYGICRINVPDAHDTGKIDFSESGAMNRYFSLLSHVNLDNQEFGDSIPSDEVLLFIHGFNVNFQEAVVRAAQIKYDLKFQGDVIVFSWPAGDASGGILEKFLITNVYKKNYNSALSSRKTFGDFLLWLADSNKTIHLIIHSMGHQVALPGIAGLGKKQKKLGEVILNAPDFSIQDFDEIAAGVANSSKRATLYCSPADNAIAASSSVHENDRLGSCKNYRDIDVINVDPVAAPLLGIGLGHGYYSSRAILTDIYQTILGVSAEKRLFIRLSHNPQSEDFILRN